MHEEHIIDSNGYELFDHGNIAFPVGYYCDNLAESPVPWHWHDELELFIVTKNKAIASLGTQQYVLKEGQGLIINAGILHAFNAHADHSCHYRSVVFHPRLIGGSMDSIYWSHYLQPFLSNPILQSIVLSPDVPWQEEILKHTKKALDHISYKSPGYEFEVRHLLSKVIFLIHENTEKVPAIYSEKSVRDANRIKHMLQFIHQNYTEDIRMEDVANAASISLSECLRCFKNTIHTTPIQYILQYRLQNAARLLESTSLKITEIGPACGLQDMSYFSRIFKRAYGCTPTEYRKRF